MKCPECRFENSPDSQYCISCGAPLRFERKPAALPCPQCRAENDPDSAFCINCGASLKSAPSAAPAEPAQPPQPRPDIKPQAPPAPKIVQEPKPASAPLTGLGIKVEAPVAAQAEITKQPKQYFSPEPDLSGSKRIEDVSPTLEREAIKTKQAQTKKLIPAVGIVLGIAAIALAVWYFALRPQPAARPALKETPAAKSAPQAVPSPTSTVAPQPIPLSPAQTVHAAEKEQMGEAAQPPATAVPRPAAPLVSSKPAGQPAATVSQLIARGIEAFQQKDYEECIREMHSVLARDPGNKVALRYLADSQNKKKDAQEIGSFIKAAGEAYQAGNFEQCLEQTKKVLALDPNQAEALRYEEIAHQKLAPQRIKSLVDQFTAAANGGQLPSYYEAVCLPALYQRIKRDLELMNGMYSQFKSQSSQTTIHFLDNGLIEARFSNITTGQLKADNRQMIVFEGTYIWTLQRQGDRWLVAGIQPQPVRKKT